MHKKITRICRKTQLIAINDCAKLKKRYLKDIDKRVGLTSFIKGDLKKRFFKDINNTLKRRKCNEKNSCNGSYSRDGYESLYRLRLVIVRHTGRSTRAGHRIRGGKRIL